VVRHSDRKLLVRLWTVDKSWFGQVFGSMILYEFNLDSLETEAD